MKDADQCSPADEHRCPRMDDALSDERLPVTYWENLREHGILYIDGSIQVIYFCPWCGTELPKSLRNEWFDRLRGMGFEPEDPRVPAAMLTDQWWKEENL